MSDKPGGDTPASQATAPIHEDHWCEHEGCKKWGSHGYDIGGRIAWRCFEHRIHDYKGRG